MIDIVARLNKGDDKLLQQVTNMANDAFGNYFSSPSYTRLKRRVQDMDDSRAMRFNTNTRGQRVTGNRWFSRLAFPLVLERYLQEHAVINANYRSERLWSLVPINETPRENAVNAQDVLMDNTRATRFKARTFLDHVNSLALYGTAINYAFPRESVRTVQRTQNTDFYGIIQEKTQVNEMHIVNSNIHILNYFQDPLINTVDDSPYNGHLERIHISEFIARVEQAKDLAERLGESSPYMMGVVEKKIKLLKKGYENNKFWTGRFTEDKTKNQNYVDLVNLWTILPVDGNEDSLDSYFIQILDGDLIRIQDNPYDYQITPYTALNTAKQMQYFWGNASAELVKPHENFFNFFQNATADNVIQSMRRYVFVDKASGIDIGDLNETYPFGGFVQTEVKNSQLMKNMFYEYQPQERALPSANYLSDKVEQSARNMTASSEFTGEQRGIAANTATGVNAMQQQSGLLQSDRLESINMGMKDIGYKTVVLLQQMMPIEFPLRRGPKQMPETIHKSEFLGDIDVDVETSLDKTKVGEANRILNAITQIVNLKGAGLPEAEVVKLAPAFRRLIQELDIGELDEVFPEQELQQQALQPQIQPQIQQQLPEILQGVA